MKLSDVQRRLAAPFPAHLVGWKPQAITKDKKRALLVAYVDARAVMDRLDSVCPNDWHFEIEVVSAAPGPTVKGRLTVLGQTREDIGEAAEGYPGPGPGGPKRDDDQRGGQPSEGRDRGAGTLKAAASDALKRAAVHFGVGRYLYDLPLVWTDWDDARRAPLEVPELPEWARPEPERTPGGAHLVQALEQLRFELPADLSAQREVYKHLRAALAAMKPGEATREQAA